MKKNLLILVLALLTQLGYAQMDEKFYYPSKEWINIDSLNYREIILPVENDTVHSILIKPKGEIKATIVYFHGNGANISKWVGHIKPLIKDGFQICMFDYQGYGKSTGKPTHVNIAHDSQVLIDTLLRREDIKQTKLIIYGASIGTQVAAHLTRNNNDKITALVLDGMMMSFTDVALATSPTEMHEHIKNMLYHPIRLKKILNT